METSATLAWWQGDKLLLWDAVQRSNYLPLILSQALGIDPAAVRVLAPHTGGAFGAKGYVWPHQIITAAAAARVVGRPLKIALTRSQMYSMLTYQGIIRQTVALACDEAGKLAAMRHDVVTVTAMSDTFSEPATEITKSLYACANVVTSQFVERANVNLNNAMRAPVEGPGSWALESAMDELAHAAGVDPLDLRIANHADVDPHHGKPWSSKKLREAYSEGAALYGWRERGSMSRRDSSWLVGHGMATCTMGNFRFPAAARIRLRPDGTAVIETNTHDIGTGTQTIFVQIAAEALGLPMRQVSIRWGDTDLPVAAPVHGSSSTMCTGGAVMAAANEAKAKLAALSGEPADTLDVAAALRRTNAEIVGEGKFALAGGAPFEADGATTPYAMRSWGAIFVEVGVDPDFGLIRLRRAVGSCQGGSSIRRRRAAR